MTPNETLAIIISGLAFILNLVVVLRRGSTQSFDQHIGYKLTKFKDELIAELQTKFIDTKAIIYEFQLRDERIVSVKDSIKALDHRIYRNSQLIANLFELALKNKNLDAKRVSEILKDQGEEI